MRSFASKIDVNSVASAQVGGYTPNPNLTFAELVRGYCLCAKPNEPRDYRLQKWLEWLGDSVIEVRKYRGALHNLFQMGLHCHRRDVFDLCQTADCTHPERRCLPKPQSTGQAIGHVPRRGEIVWPSQ